jgi:hypothetical protein
MAGGERGMRLQIIEMMGINKHLHTDGGGEFSLRLEKTERKKPIKVASF